MRRFLLGSMMALLGTAAPIPADGQDRAPTERRRMMLGDASSEVYKSVDGAELLMFRVDPDGIKPGDLRPAVVFFFGGGWETGSPRQFEQQARYFAHRGMVSFVAEYRVRSRHRTDVVQCVADAKSAIRWVRANAERLGVDPDRVVASGGSAGGHLAAATAIVSEFDDPSEDAAISSRPNVAVLFNPAVVLAPIGDQLPLEAGRYEQLRERIGAPPESVSPYHHVASDQPPLLIFHGTADETVPHHTVELFRDRYQEVGNECRLVSYPDKEHGFFNFGRNANRSFVETVTEMDRFLAELGYLEGEPSVGEWVQGRRR